MKGTLSALPRVPGGGYFGASLSGCPAGGWAPPQATIPSSSVTGMAVIFFRMTISSGRTEQAGRQVASVSPGRGAGEKKAVRLIWTLAPALAETRLCRGIDPLLPRRGYITKPRVAQRTLGTRH